MSGREERQTLVVHLWSAIPKVFSGAKNEACGGVPKGAWQRGWCGSPESALMRSFMLL